MSRGLSAPLEAAAGAEVVRPVWLVDLDFDSGPVRLASTPFDITDGATTYTGIGTLGAVGTVQEGAEIKPWGVTLTLSGIPAEVITLALGEHVQGRTCVLKFALLDAGHRVIDAPVTLWSGRMDTMDVQLGDTCSATITAESRLVDWERPRIRRYNDQDQRAQYPGDLGFEYVAATTDMELIWGRA